MTTISMDPFDQPPIVIAKMKLDEFLTSLRGRINKGYMPSANGNIKHNSKPDYLKNIGDVFVTPGNNAIVHCGSGYYSADVAFDCHSPYVIYLYLDVDRIGILVNLANDKTWVGVDAFEGIDHWVEWTDQELVVDRELLAERIDGWC